MPLGRLSRVPLKKGEAVSFRTNGLMMMRSLLSDSGGGGGGRMDANDLQWAGSATDAANRSRASLDSLAR